MFRVRVRVRVFGIRARVTELRFMIMWRRVVLLFCQHQTLEGGCRPGSG